VAISDSGGAPGFSISAGSLPPGLGINSGTGVISGTPSASGSYSFTVQVNDSGETDSHAYTIYIGVQITTTSLPDGTKDNPYSQTIQITDASGTPGFSISAGSLPPGLTAIIIIPAALIIMALVTRPARQLIQSITAYSSLTMISTGCWYLTWIITTI
jgi:hypothetical protein